MVAITPDAVDALCRVRVAGQRARAREHDRTPRRVQPRADRGSGSAAGDRSSRRRRSSERLFEDLPTLDELERRYLLHVLQAVGGNRSRAAEVLGIDRRTLYRMAERFGIDLPLVGDDE